MTRRLPLIFTPQPEGGFTVTSPARPELVTEGDTLEEAFANVKNAFAAVMEIYSEEGRALLAGMELPPAGLDRRAGGVGVKYREAEGKLKLLGCMKSREAVVARIASGTTRPPDGRRYFLTEPAAI